jgi:parvulin-like peptidyl-prolyl isomerase
LAKKKRKAEKPPREYTRRQLSQFQRQKRRQRIVFITGVSIIAAIVLIVLVGWFIGEYRPMHQTVIRVNDAEFNMGYYIDALAIEAQNQPSNSTESPLEYIQSRAGAVVSVIEQNELIRQEAMKLGISVSDDEIKEQLKGSDIPLNDTRLDLVRAQMLQNRLYNEYFEHQVPASAEQVHIMAMLLESESQAYEMRTRLQNSENFSALAEEYSLDYYTKTNKGDLGWHTESILDVLLGSTVPGDYAFGSEAGILSQPVNDEEIYKSVGYWIVRLLEKEEETAANVKVILLGSEAEAQSVLDRLRRGEDFASLAKELSQHEESRDKEGDMGMVSKGEVSTAFDEFVFSEEAEPGDLLGPIPDVTIQTKGGYWLINVLDRDDDRQLESEDRNYLMARAFEEWVSLLWVDPGNVVDNSYLDYETKVWAIERAIKGLG